MIIFPQSPWIPKDFTEGTGLGQVNLPCLKQGQRKASPTILTPREVTHVGQRSGVGYSLPWIPEPTARDLFVLNFRMPEMSQHTSLEPAGMTTTR